jgi:hypothetical protein
VIPTFLAAIGWIPAALGLGTMLRLDPDEDVRVAVNGFAGLGVLALAAMVVHLVSLVGSGIATIVFAAGLLLFARDPRAAAGMLDGRRIAVAAVAVLGLAALAQPAGVHYDTGLYHLQALRWTSEVPLVRGLANLHHRFGYVSAWVPVAAATEHGLLAHRSAAYLNVLPVFFAGTAVVRAARRFVGGDRSFATTFLVLGAAPVAMALWDVGGLEHDHAVSLLGVLVFALWLRAHRDAESFATDATAAFVLSVLAATLKLSAAPLAVGSALLLARSWRRLDRARAVPIAAAVLLGLAWIVRSVLLSGCLAFPATATCLDALPWSARAAAEWGAFTVREWARVPGSIPPAPRTAWIAEWARSYAPYLAVFGAALTGGIALGLTRGEPRARRAFLAAWAGAAAGVAFWFVSAPDFRFGLAYLFPFVLLPAAWGLSQRPVTARAGVRRAAVALLGAALVLFAAALLHLRPKPPDASFAWLSWPAFPVVPVELRSIAGGVTVGVPARGDQCWDAPRPCTPEVAPSLRARDTVFVAPRAPSALDR